MSNIGGELSQMNPNCGVKVWLQKELNFVGLAKFGGLAKFLCIGGKIREKVKSWVLSNLCGE